MNTFIAVLQKATEVEVPLCFALGAIIRGIYREGGGEVRKA